MITSAQRGESQRTVDVDAVGDAEICGGGCELPEGSCPACLGAI